MISKEKLKSVKLYIYNEVKVKDIINLKLLVRLKYNDIPILIDAKSGNEDIHFNKFKRVN